MRTRRLPSRTRGFTLIELLVVITVIAILAALLFPVLTGVKRTVLGAVCLTREREWAMAFVMYANDNDGSIPREGAEPLGEVLINNWGQVRGVEAAGGGLDSDDVWYNALPQVVDKHPAYYYASAMRKREFYEWGNMMQCPGARFPKAADRLNYQFALFSMAMNSHLIRAGEGPTINFQKILNHHPEKIVLFLDNLLEGESKVDPGQEIDNLGQPASYADRFSARHRKGGNLVFADGHAEWFQGYKVVQTNANSLMRGGAILPAKDIIWELPYNQ